MDLFILLTAILLSFFGVMVIATGNPFPKVLKDFDKKIWMALGLGIIFATVYVGVLFLLTYLLRHFSSQQIFTFLYEHPVESIYAGLGIFIFFSLSVYLARLLVITLYKIRKKRP